ncbi:MAG TPA: deoxyribodipyrimidine photolyase [Polyangiaceae bacterium]|nr:deoxyribodipyrimidine photolyase [Polyangiaceae bacterium]
MIASSVPELRVRAVNAAELRASGKYVLYWMIAARRTHDNFALDRALEYAKLRNKPLLVLEALRVAYPFASDRFHRFVLDGMSENARAFAHAGIAYHAYVEPEAGAGSGLLLALAKDAVVIVTDDFPCFFLPRMLAAAGKKLSCRLEAVDSNGVLPIRALDKACFRAFDFRRALQKSFAQHWLARPAQRPLARLHLPTLAFPLAIRKRWPSASAALLRGEASALATLAIDHTLPSVSYRGGFRTAQKTLHDFIEHKLEHYDEGRNHPDKSASSGLSPYLHFGQLSAHRVVDAIAEHEDWKLADLGGRARGERAGFWNMRPSSEAFLDQLLVWRELGLNYCAHEARYQHFDTLPAWAQKTLTEHRSDPRPVLYTRAQLEAARTHDPLWNAAQRELVREGRIHNYLRMLWGKKILQWSKTPEQALATAIFLNDRYALDGRDPNSYSGISWCFGRYDRAWGPVRPIFGTIRYMSSENTAKKLWLTGYLAKYGEAAR